MSSIPKISYTGLEPKGYPSGERHRSRPLLKEISSMTDDEILRASVRNAGKEVEKSGAARVLKYGPLAFLAATTMVWGALKKGKLSDKVFETAKAAGTAAAVLAVSKPVDDVTGLIFDSKEGEEKNPALKGVVNFAALLGTSALLIKGVKSGTKALGKIFEPTAKALEGKISKAADWMNNTTSAKVLDKVSKHASEFSNMHPKLSSVLRISAILSPLAATIGVAHAANKKMENQMETKTAANINKLVLCREFAQGAVQSTSSEKENN